MSYSLRVQETKRLSYEQPNVYFQYSEDNTDYETLLPELEIVIDGEATTYGEIADAR